MKPFLLLVLSFLLAPGNRLQAAEPSPAVFSFEETALGPDWQTRGDVSLVAGGAYRGNQSLKLTRSADQAHLPLNATSPAFPVTPGVWEIDAAGEADIYSPDSSFNVKVWLQLLNSEGQQIDRIPVGDITQKKEWTLLSRRIELPDSATAARFFLEMNKTYGTFKADALNATFRGVGRRKTETVDRILFSTAQMGNLLYPRDPRVVRILVETFKPLLKSQCMVTLQIRDYWGAEQFPPLTAELKPLSDTSYEAEIDLASAPLQIGRYYELHAFVPQSEGKPSENHSSFAILPNAPNKAYPPEEIPFTSRNWNNEIEEFPPLVDRLGIRICGIKGMFSSTPPYPATAKRIDLVKKLGMGALTTTPIFFIEHQKLGWEKYDEKALREGIRNLIETIGDVRPLVVNLGNEPPHHNVEVVKRDVAAYKIVYEEIKKIDPSIFVLGSSAGPEEPFFKQGFGEWCDAYDFHTYGDPETVRSTLRAYRELFKKYGHAKPVWSTEIGLNCQGLERRAVSADMIKKITGFFAEGGANIAWFGFIYPDPQLKLLGSSEEAFNMFDCRHARYAPRLDAVTYYHVVNGIGIKKFVEEKNYPDGIYAALFRDRDGGCLQVLWREQGDTDVFVPLPGAEKVRSVRLDGTTHDLEADGAGVTLSIGNDPVLLEYKNASAPLANALGEPKAAFGNMDRPLVASSTSTIFLKPADTFSVDLEVPPLWKSEKNDAGYQLTPPMGSRVREASLAAAVKDAEGRTVGDLYRRPPVSEKLCLRLLPEPATDGKEAGIRVVLTNNGSSPLEAFWNATLTGELTLEKGVFGPSQDPTLEFTGPTSGTVSLEPGQTESIVLPLPRTDPSKLYKVRATASDKDGAFLTGERLVGGFVGVRKTTAPPVMDGVLDESVWTTAPAVTIDQGNHFCQLGRAGVAKTASWSGAGDLSAKARFLWDEKYLYLGIEVQDDIAGTMKSDALLWSQDGLQFLIDPARESANKPGKYDYAVALGAKGPQAWCYLTADPVKAPVREVKDFLIGAKRSDDKSGRIVYEVAIPWRRVAPFRPEAGANLGFTLIFNEDDGQGRDSFLAWFGNAHTKQVDTAGDLILLP